MRIMVTGASGLVGRAVAACLAQAGHEVVGLSRRGRGVGKIHRSLACDITDSADLARVASEPPCEAIVHAAAITDLGPHAGRVIAVNCLGTQHVLELAERWSTLRFVFMSSLPVIGRPRLLPVTEEHPVDPVTTYHASKLFGEHLTHLAARRGVAAASLRLSSPVGPGVDPGRIIGVFVRRALAGEPLEVDGEGRRAQDFVDVRDVADGVLACVETGSRGLFNIARGEPVANAELARACVEALGSTSEVRTGGRPDPEEGVRWEISIDRAARAFGYSPSRTLAESITAAAGAG